MMVLQIIFGMTITNLSVYVRFARRIIISVLCNDPLAAISIPNNIEIEEYKDAQNAWHPPLKEVWCMMDVLKLKLQRATWTTKSGEVI
jgi:hypothetical protein